MHPTKSAGLGAVAAACAVLAAGLMPATPAAADALGDARARAATLAAQVGQLQTRAEVVTEKYDAIEARLSAAVDEQSLAERQAEADDAAAQQAADQVDAGVRALYESGGSATMLETVLAGSSPADVLTGLHTVGDVLAVNRASVEAAQIVTAAAEQRAAHLDAVASHVTQLQVAAAGLASEVQQLLEQQRAALASTNNEVRRLVVARQRALAIASAQSFRDALAATGASLHGTTTAPNAIAAGAIAAARTRLGDPYVWGATGPSAFDCSGLTQWSYAHVGIHLPRVAADQWNAGPHIPLDQLLPGDLLFWATDLNDPATIHHVTMYLGDGMMIAAPHTGENVQVQPVYMTGYMGATRPYSTGG